MADLPFCSGGLSPPDCIPHPDPSGFSRYSPETYLGESDIQLENSSDIAFPIFEASGGFNILVVLVSISAIRFLGGVGK